MCVCVCVCVYGAASKMASVGVTGLIHAARGELGSVCVSWHPLSEKAAVYDSEGCLPSGLLRLLYYT